MKGIDFMQKTYFKNPFFNILFAIIAISVVLLVLNILIDMNILGESESIKEFGRKIIDIVFFTNIFAMILAIVFKIIKKIRWSEMFTVIPINFLVIIVSLILSLRQAFSRF